MAQINFPVATADGQTFEAQNGVIYTYNGVPPNGYWSGSFQNEGFNTLDGRYLKLDSSNDPVTGGLIVNAGNVGIGTSSPQSELTVRGSTPQITLEPTGDSQNCRLQFCTTDGTVKSSIMSGGIDGGAIRFFDNIVFAERMRIDSSGKVGIGNADPDQILTVGNTTTSNIIRMRAGGTSVNGLDFGDAADADIGRIRYAHSDDSLAFTTNTSEKLRITSNGNVGIGTTGPIAQLTARAINSAGQGGTMCIQNTGTGVGTNVALYLTPNNGGGNDLLRSASIKSSQEISGNYANLEFYTADSSTPVERMRIDRLGNVGIGTSTPGTYAGGSTLALSSTGGARIGLNATGRNYYIGGDSGSDRLEIGRRVASNTADSADFVLNAGGDVGIGMTNPGAKLGVSDTANTTFTNTPFVVKLQSTDAPAIGLGSGITFTGRWSNTATQFADFGVISGIKENATSGNYAGALTFGTRTNGSGSGSMEKMRISSTGNVGIGTTAPTARLTQAGGHFHNNRPSDFWNATDYISIAGYGGLTTQGSYELDLQCNGYRNSSNTWTRLNTNSQVGAAKVSLNPSGYIKFCTEANKANGSSSAITERMRIESSGRILVGTTTGYDNNYKMNVAMPLTGGIAFRSSSTNTKYPLAFQNNSGSFVGSVKITTTTTTYNTSSDYRLKENIVDISDGITRIKQLAPKRFNFIVDTDTTVDGFIAHEAQAVVPESVVGVKDGMIEEEYEVSPEVVDESGEVRQAAVIGTRTVPDYQGIDQSKLVPLLTAALQEAIAKIETLEQRLADAGIA